MPKKLEHSKYSFKTTININPITNKDNEEYFNTLFLFLRFKLLYFILQVSFSFHGGCSHTTQLSQKI